MAKSFLLIAIALASPVSAQVTGTATIAAAADRPDVVIANGFP